MTAILVIDNYDSFVHTLAGYLRELGAETTVIRNDDVSAEELPALLAQYDGVLLSPGPGVPSDSGVSPDVIRRAAATDLPLLGVCLGHQALGEVFGATVDHSPTLMHGKTSSVEHDGTGLFAQARNPLTATRYHSLAVVDSTIDPEVFEVNAWTPDGVVMAMKLRGKPLYGVQFHPESVLTEDGYRMLGAWLAVTGDAGAVERAADKSPIAQADLSAASS